MHESPSKPSLKPVPKVANATAAGAAVTILVWVLDYFAHVPVPSYVAAAAVIVVAGGVGYLTKP